MTSDQHFEHLNVENLKMRRCSSDPATHASDETGLMLSKHGDDDIMTGTKEAIEQYVESFGQHFILKCSPYLEQGSEQAYLGRW